MSRIVQQSLEDVIEGRPAFDDPHIYGFVHETIRPRVDDRKMVALCFDCMENPKREARVVGKSENGDIFDHPLRCESCESKHTRRVKAARKAKGVADGEVG